MSEAPIILLGAHRSGTTWLGRVFAQHPALAYHEEPRNIWTWGNAYTPDDMLTQDDATDRVRAHIHKAFDKYVARHDAARLCEKTPSNLLRIPFIRAVYPDAKLVMIVRDGRSVLRSTDEILARGVPLSLIARRAATTPIAEWPAYAGATFGAISRKVTGRKLEYWGPRPPGWREWVGQDHPDVVLAKQWAGCVSRALIDAADIEAHGQEPVLIFRYEDMMAQPREVMTRICEHCQLKLPGPIIDEAEATADPARVNKWRAGLDEDTLDRARPHMEPVMSGLGYRWDAPAVEPTRVAA